MTSPTDEQRIGDWMQTFTGLQFWPLDPRPEEIDIEDIIHALSNLCRFSGHCHWFYSVAQHSIMVSQIVAQPYAMEALLHDAAEAYIGDMIRPLKSSIPLFKSIEYKIERVIIIKFNLRTPPMFLIKEADNIALATEARDIMGPPPKEWNLNGAKPLKETIVPWTAKESEIRFMDRFEELGGDI